MLRQALAVVFGIGLNKHVSCARYSPINRTETDWSSMITENHKSYQILSDFYGRYI